MTCENQYLIVKEGRTRTCSGELLWKMQGPRRMPTKAGMTRRRKAG